jgi:hypothetical protein
MYEPLQPLCKQVATQAGIPESWRALESRVIRKREKATVGAESEITSTVHDEAGGATRRAAKRYLKNAEPEQIAEVIEILPAERA